MTTDETTGRDLERETHLVFALFNLIAADVGHYPLERPVPLFSAAEPALALPVRARIAALIVSDAAIDTDFPAQRAWVAKSGYDLLMLRDSTPDNPEQVAVDVLRATSAGAVDEGRLWLWSGEDDVRVEMSSLWLLTPDDTGAELSRSLLVTGRGLLVSERPPYRDVANRGAGLHVAAAAFRRLLAKADGDRGTARSS